MRLDSTRYKTDKYTSELSKSLKRLLDDIMRESVQDGTEDQHRNYLRKRSYLNGNQDSIDSEMIKNIRVE